MLYKSVATSGAVYLVSTPMFGCYSSQEYHADEKLLDIVIESG
jgi:hypothetical protein